MRIRFDKRNIEKLEPADSDYEVAEEGGPPGFVVRVTPAGTRTFYWNYKFRGKRRRLRLGDVQHTSVSAARKAYNAAVALRDQGVDPYEQRRAQEAAEAAEEAASITVSELCDRYLKRRKIREKRTYAEDVRQLDKYVRPKWGRRPVTSITKRDVHRLLDDLAERAPTQANRVLAVMKPLFEYAEDRELIPASPCASTKKPAKEVKRDRHLTFDECAAVLKGLNGKKVKMGEPSRWVIRLCLLTGQRLGEVSGAEWSEFDGKAWNIPGERTKNGKPHRVPVTPLLEASLELLRERAKGSPYVFPTASPRAKSPHVLGESVSSALGKERDEKGRAFGVDHFRIHDLRHTFATRLAELGVEFEVVARLMNHSLTSITARYNQFDYWEPATRALEAWHEKLLKITKPEDWPGVRLP